MLVNVIWIFRFKSGNRIFHLWCFLKRLVQRASENIRTISVSLYIGAILIKFQAEEKLFKKCLLILCYLADSIDSFICILQRQLNILQEKRISFREVSVSK